ncbi:eIF2A-domain-containing protein [Coccomyxa subellipsoidea C-169]|uniref:Eukaryotic translation initiation factor 2A n=1 Tax=Coccomyxa subellipsoidea (strain C-169) TaxID=574566 RepID=I0YU62_COCSC|nr:eIF2A-domain-containing protein [Coccomyxa subellipsoidea C-169]EIE21931.1 eIF2A-domain-containing protein [Coccomyxa subellipsoidea C-169]|eukprot:XP_005646475.1 eIF2A-domain-containing protein [Coccomyxa subellipsoidea C-169]
MSAEGQHHDLPPQQITVRIPDVASVVSLVPKKTPLALATTKISKVPAGSLLWSEDGAYLAAMSPNAVTIYDGRNQDQVAALTLPTVVAVSFSPQNTYLTTFQRPAPGSGNAEKNLKVWDWRKGTVVMQLFQKSFSRDHWPAVAFTADETSALHLVTNAVNVYDPHNFSQGVAKKLAVKGLAGFAVSPNTAKPLLAAYVPEGKSAPGFVGIWDLNQLSKGDSPAPIARRSFFRANAAQLLWNAKGTALLALTSSDTDATNQSYYGEQKLNYLSADGKNDCIVQLKEGPVHDVQWSPSGEHFITVAGFMPAKSTVFTEACKPFFDLGSGGHNLVRWSPQGRFVAVAGFGNLPGDILFFDKKADGKLKQMGATRADNAVSLEWAPDGRSVLTATTAPRLRVDNGFQIYKYTGEKLLEQKVEVLLEARWQPAPRDTFPDRPQSPRANGSAPAAPAAAKASGYVLPHLRGSAAGASSSGNFSLGHDPNDSRGRIGVNAHHKTLVPGAPAPDTKTASKNAKRRQRAKAKGGDGQASEDGAEPAAQVKSVTEGVSALTTAEPQAQEDSGADAAKRLRNLQKKLRQVQQLKEKQAGGAALEPEQLQKIASEAGLLQEISMLEGQT